jgi:Zn-dependent M28 family amino/carboxypeptidase
VIQGKFLNVVAELPGDKTPERIYIICAHYDSVSSNVPGGDDNASGTAGVLEAARVLSRHSFECTIRFICFNDEEDGMDGSGDYVENVVKVEKEKVIGVVNLDMIIHPRHDRKPDLPKVMGVSTARRHKASKEWAWRLIAAAKTLVPDLTVDADSPYIDTDSDDLSFCDEGYAAVSLSEDGGGGEGLANAHYHTSQDASDRAAGAHYDYAYATKVVKVAVAFVAKEAGLIGAREQKAKDKGK